MSDYYALSFLPLYLFTMFSEEFGASVGPAACPFRYVLPLAARDLLTTDALLSVGLSAPSSVQ
jgi:hypothetical protein